MDAPALVFDSISHSFGSFRALDRLSLTIQPGEFVALVGPSGCGKTTLLNIAAGLLAPSAGRVSVFGKALSTINPRATYLFQQEALLPWKTILENVSAGLRWSNRPASEAKEEAKAWLARVGLVNFADHYPAQLSGGMRRRVALAQNWILHRDILLLDEPFAALDVHTRLQMHAELLALWTLEKKTALLVTHDLDEAVTLADRVCVVSSAPARVIASHQVNLPRPRDPLSARFESSFQDLVRTLWQDLRPQMERHAD